MNKPDGLARWLGTCGVLEIATGLALLATPAAVAYGLLRISPGGSATGRLAGAALPAYNLTACAALAWAGPARGNGGVPARTAAALLGGLGLALAIALFGRRRISAETPTLER
ncbi:MAG TPA: hypothetical protein P5567_13670 [Kiritimatiellia bacterium]|nr:hypothetical protein [Kiritimatiellia bacterium]HRZ13492.1 hypothetical protein [Kiritimatiellia bacterium]HSA19203.1 hypothetical protein [Kiritimatiellia bacterium]